jgi:hypothetical protein
MTISKHTARSLAVAYQAFCEFRANGEHERAVYWGERLAELQSETGIALHSTELLSDLINGAKRRAA